MDKENKNISPDEVREKLMTRLEKALGTINEYKDELTNSDVGRIEATAWEIEGRVCRKKTGSYWRDWYPMDGTIEEIEGR